MSDSITSSRSSRLLAVPSHRHVRHVYLKSLSERALKRDERDTHAKNRNSRFFPSLCFSSSRARITFITSGPECGA